MKKALLILSLVVFAANFTQTNAQGLFVKVQPGYGLPMASSNLGTNDVNSTSSTSSEVVKGSYGKGFNIGASIGYMFSENIGAELGIGYHIGSSYDITSQGIVNTSTQTLKGSQFRLNPALIVAAGSEGFVPYAKFGLILGLANKLTEENTEAGNSSARTWEYTGGMALGLNGAFGAAYHVSDLIAIYGELEVIGMSYAPTKGTLTVLKDANGADVLSQVTDIRDKEKEFVDKLSDTVPSAATDPNKPKQELKQYSPFSSFGINVGVQLSFGGGGGGHHRRH
ncbi:MAG: outer membrane beta-barrel protein [Bacteroidota bacterium]